MFNKLSLLALLAPLVSALTLSAPSNVTSGGSFTLTWTSTPSDPAFSLELTNPSFNNAIAIANNVDPSLNSITLTCPIVAAGGSYTIQAVNIGNINNVYSETSIFSIGATVTTSGSAASSSVSPTTVTGTTLTANSLSVTTSSPTVSVSTSTSPSTGTGTTGTGTGTAATTSSSSAAVSSRLALSNAGGYAILMLSAVAGAAAIAL